MSQDWKEKIAENLRLKYKNRWDGGSISEYDFYEACEEYHKAIKETDVCEWVEMENPRRPFIFITGCNGMRNQDKNGQYCPYCSRKIKEVE